MRIHTKLERHQIVAALRDAKRWGQISQSVSFDRLDEHRSTKAPRRFDVKLEAWAKQDDDGRRQINTGTTGAPSGSGGAPIYAATYDEWGYFLAGIFERDADAIMDQYADRASFLRQTGYSYSPERLLQLMLIRGRDPYPFVVGRQSGRAGRVGAGRITGDTLPPAIRDSLMGTGPIIHTATTFDVFWRPRRFTEISARIDQKARSLAA